MGPRLTIGMPCYNAQPFIAATIDNLLGQTHADFVLLVSDNASTDETRAIVQSYAACDPRVKLIEQATNIGANANYNHLARSAETEYFKWHSTNDLISPNALEACIDVLDENRDVALCFPRTFLFSDSVDDAEPYDLDTEAEDDNPLERFFRVVDRMNMNNIMNGVVRTRALLSTRLLGQYRFADRATIAELALIGKLRCAANGSFYRRMDARTATQLKTEKEVSQHLNPQWNGMPPFQAWRGLVGLGVSLWRSDLGLLARLRGGGGLVRRGWWWKSQLWGDVRQALITRG